MLIQKVSNQKIHVNCEKVFMESFIGYDESSFFYKGLHN